MYNKLLRVPKVGGGAEKKKKQRGEKVGRSSKLDSLIGLGFWDMP